MHLIVHERGRGRVVLVSEIAVPVHLGLVHVQAWPPLLHRLEPSVWRLQAVLYTGWVVALQTPASKFQRLIVSSLLSFHVIGKMTQQSVLLWRKAESVSQSVSHGSVSSISCRHFLQTYLSNKELIFLNTQMWIVSHIGMRVSTVIFPPGSDKLFKL